MEYINEKTITNITKLISTITYDANNIKEDLSLELPIEELERLWRVCGFIANNAERAKVLIGKMLDEYDDMGAEDEGE